MDNRTGSFRRRQTYARPIGLRRPLLHRRVGPLAFPLRLDPLAFGLPLAGSSDQRGEPLAGNWLTILALGDALSGQGGGDLDPGGVCRQTASLRAPSDSRTYAMAPVRRRPAGPTLAGRTFFEGASRSALRHLRSIGMHRRCQERLKGLGCGMANKFTAVIRECGNYPSPPKTH
jgi:hypothetical protein